MYTDIGGFIREHRAGMQYLGELVHMAKATIPIRPQRLGATTVYDEMGNVIYTDESSDPLPNAPNTAAETHSASFSEAFPNAYNTVQDVLQLPATLASSAGKVVLIGAFAVGVIVVLPHVLDYMTARQRRK